jgi:hypothetical protein
VSKPFGALDAAGVRWVVQVAGRAPSVHNTQPWIFVWDGRHLDLHGDRNRRLDIVDPDGRQLTISCGAALLHARLALAGLGRPAVVCLLPDPANSDHLARITVGPVVEQPCGTRDWDLLWAVSRRHTVRGVFRPTPLPGRLRADLAAATRDEHGELRFVDIPAERDTVAELIAAADRTQEAQSSFRLELREWVREDSVDGIPPYAAGNGWLDQACPFRSRNFGDKLAPGDDLGHRDAEFGNEPTVALLHTREDTPRAWLEAGQALARVLLTATRGGVNASMLNQPIEVDGARQALADRLGITGHPQTLLRLGYSAPGRPTPRCAIDDVLIDRAAPAYA